MSKNKKRLVTFAATTAMMAAASITSFAAFCPASSNFRNGNSNSCSYRYSSNCYNGGSCTRNRDNNCFSGSCNGSSIQPQNMQQILSMMGSNGFYGNFSCR